MAPTALRETVPADRCRHLGVLCPGTLLPKPLSTQSYGMLFADLGTGLPLRQRWKEMPPPLVDTLRLDGFDLRRVQIFPAPQPESQETPTEAAPPDPAIAAVTPTPVTTKGPVPAKNTPVSGQRRQTIAMNAAGRDAIALCLQENPKRGEVIVQRHLESRNLGNFSRDEIRAVIGDWKKAHLADRA
jgi:hypothetical protein